MWKCHSTGSDKDVCLTADTNKANPHFGTAGSDLGIKTYPERRRRVEDRRRRGLGLVQLRSRPEAGLLLDRQPRSVEPAYRCGDKTHEECNTGEWDNKWSMTIFARKVDTGEAVWAYQMTPFDQWDYDGVNENILTDMDIDGKKVKALTHFDRNGFAYVLDRTNGTLLRANKYVTVDWAEKVDLKTGRPIKVREHSPLRGRPQRRACPSAMGGKDQQPCSVDPKEPNKFYCPTNNWCMEDEPQERTHTQQGTVYVFANVYMYPEKPGTTGKIKKFDVLTGKADGKSRIRIRTGAAPWSPTAAWCSTARSAATSALSIASPARSLAPQARLRHHRQPDHLQGEGQAVCVDLLRHRRLDRHSGYGWPRPQRQVRRDRCDGHG